MQVSQENVCYHFQNDDLDDDSLFSKSNKILNGNHPSNFRVVSYILNLKTHTNMQKISHYFYWQKILFVFHKNVARFYNFIIACKKVSSLVIVSLNLKYIASVSLC